MANKIKFYSGLRGAETIAEVLQERDATVKLKLPDGNVIIKKKRQVEFL